MGDRSEKTVRGPVWLPDAVPGDWNRRRSHGSQGPSRFPAPVAGGVRVPPPQEAEATLILMLHSITLLAALACPAAEPYQDLAQRLDERAAAHHGKVAIAVK